MSILKVRNDALSLAAFITFFINLHRKSLISSDIYFQLGIFF